MSAFGMHKPDWLVKMTMRVPKQDTGIGDLDRLIEQEGRCG
jgi:hypothetical protein